MFTLYAIFKLYINLMRSGDEPALCQKLELWPLLAKPDWTIMKKNMLCPQDPFRDRFKPMMMFRIGAVRAVAQIASIAGTHHHHYTNSSVCNVVCFNLNVNGFNFLRILSHFKILMVFLYLLHRNRCLMMMPTDSTRSVYLPTIFNRSTNYYNVYSSSTNQIYSIVKYCYIYIC